MKSSNFTIIFIIGDAVSLDVRSPVFFFGKFSSSLQETENPTCRLCVNCIMAFTSASIYPPIPPDFLICNSIYGAALNSDACHLVYGAMHTNRDLLPRYRPGLYFKDKPIEYLPWQQATSALELPIRYLDPQGAFDSRY